MYIDGYSPALRLAHWDGIQPYSDENTSRLNFVRTPSRRGKVIGTELELYDRSLLY